MLEVIDERADTVADPPPIVIEGELGGTSSAEGMDLDINLVKPGPADKS